MPLYTLKAHLPVHTARAQAVWGQTSGEALARVRSSLSGYDCQPSCAMVHLGSNDFCQDYRRVVPRPPPHPSRPVPPPSWGSPEHTCRGRRAEVASRDRDARDARRRRAPEHTRDSCERHSTDACRRESDPPPHASRHRNSQRGASRGMSWAYLGVSLRVECRVECWPLPCWGLCTM